MSEEKKTNEKVTKKQKEDFEHKYKLLLADTENLRKRIEEEKSQIYKYRATSFLSDILPTVDMFDMALKSKAPKEVKNWLIGFEMVLSNLKQVLEQEGVKKIKVFPGDDFDSSNHFVIEEQESDKHKPGKIIKVQTEGYKLHDRLLRPATVIVAKANKKPKGEKK